VRAGWLDETIAHNQAELAVLRKALAREGALRKENSELLAAGEAASRLLLPGETTGIAGANLQKLVSALVAQHGGTASSLQILPPSEDGNLMRIPMSLSISVDIDGLRSIIHGLEAGMPLIFVDDIAIRPQWEAAGSSDPHYLGPLDVMLQVSGFVARNGAS
jgi:general secretion pathway protein M